MPGGREMDEGRVMKIDILIPAYNEEKNIGVLLNLISNQTIFNKVNNIYVISDDSTDKTHEIVREEAKKNKKIILIIKKQRVGKFDSLNKGFKTSNADILIMLDADISFDQNDALEKLIEPFNLDRKIGLTTLEAKAKAKKLNYTSIASLFSYYILKEVILSKENYQYDNFYSLRGTALAIKKELYKKIKIYNDPGDDQHLFFLTISNNYKTFLVDKRYSYYNVPSNIKDFLKQGKRFKKALAIKYSFYNKRLIKERTKIGLNAPFIFLKVFLKHPISGIFWLPLYSISRLSNYRGGNGAWDIATSTK